MMRHSLACFFASFALGFVPSAYAEERTSPESGSKPIPPEFAGLRDRWAAAMGKFRVPGFAVVVTKNDEVIYLDTFGFRDRERQLPVTPDTSFYIASATKPFVAMAVMTLVDAGKLRLDDPVVKYLPRFELPDKAVSDAVTIRDLLCHKRGIQCGPAVFLDAYTGQITEDRYYKFLRSQGDARGSTVYSNTHFTLAGRVIEAVAGMSWRDYLAQAIFKPAGLSSATGYADAMYARGDVGLPYDVDEGGLQLAAVRKTDATMHAAGGLGLSITDMGRWLRLNLNRGQIDGKRIVSDASAAEMQTLQSESAQGRIRVIEGFGLGWQIGTFRPGGPTYLMHNGGYIGAAAHSSFLPEKNVGVAVLTNCGPPGALFAESVVSIDVLDRIVGGQHPDFLEQARRALPRVAELEANAARAKAVVPVSAPEVVSVSPELYAGTYVNADFGTLRVNRTATSLMLRIGDLPLPLTSCRSDAFEVLVVNEPRTGRFDVVDGKVQAVVMQLEAGEIRFERKQ